MSGLSESEIEAIKAEAGHYEEPSAASMLAKARSGFMFLVSGVSMIFGLLFSIDNPIHLLLIDIIVG